MGTGVAGSGVDVAVGRDVLAGEINAVGMAGEVDGMLHDVMVSRKTQNAKQRRDSLLQRRIRYILLCAAQRCELKLKLQAVAALVRLDQIIVIIFPSGSHPITIKAFEKAKVLHTLQLFALAVTVKAV